MRRTPRILAALALTATASAVPATAQPHDIAGEPAAQRAIEIADVAQLRRIQETHLSPDGTRAAAVISEPSVADNTVTSRVVLLDLNPSKPARTVTTVTGTTDRLTNLRWSPDGRSLTYLAGSGGADAVWWVPAEGGRPRKLFDAPCPAVRIGGTILNFGTAATPPHEAKVLAYEWAPTNRRLAFTTPRPMGDPTGDGVVYDDTTMSGYSILHGQYDRFRTGVWVLDPGTGEPRHLIDLDTGPIARSGPQLTWSADGTRLKLTFRGQDTIIDVTSGERVDPFPAAEPPRPTRPGCSPETVWHRALCLRESVSSPPRLTVLDVPSGVEHEKYDPNAAFRNIRIVPPAPAEWTNKYGHKAIGYQIVPPGCGQGHRCPAVVITHGHDAGDRFMWEGHEWHYPSQVFAARGYVVLLVNESREAPEDDLWRDVVAVMESTVQAAVDAGYADPDKVGIMGYGRGAEVTQLAVSHSTVFKAASSGDGGGGTAGYWFFGAQNPDAAERAEQVFGGSPVDPDAVQNWRDYAPDLRADQINSPLLLQCAEPTGVANLELFNYIKVRDVPTELVVFPDETHIFHQPRHRAAAMRQNVDWFDYWLLDRHDPDSSGGDQYARWDALKRAWKPSI